MFMNTTYSLSRNWCEQRPSNTEKLALIVRGEVGKAYQKQMELILISFL
jgi:hypothetical protein